MWYAVTVAHSKLPSANINITHIDKTQRVKLHTNGYSFLIKDKEALPCEDASVSYLEHLAQLILLQIIHVCFYFHPYKDNQ